MKSLIRTGSIALFFLALAAIPFAAPLLGGSGAAQWDAREVHLTNLIFSSRAWHDGFLPFWTPYIFGGFPQIADMQVAIFYPINLLMGLFSVFNQTMLFWQVVGHFALAGFGMFLLVRHLTTHVLAGVFAGAAYMFCGFMVGHATHVGMQNTAAWLPIVFLLLYIALERESYAWAAGAGLGGGVAILAGHFQMSVFLLFALGIYFLYDFSLSWYRARLPPARKLFVFLLMTFIIFLIAAVQLIPTFELAQRSQRSAISLELAQTESLNPQSLHALLDVNYQGVAFGPYTGPWDRTENYLFLGITTLGFALAALLLQVRRPRDTRIIFFTALASIAILYSFGKYGFVHQYFYLLPIFNKMRAPANMMLLFDFAGVVLAGMGLSMLTRAFPRFRIFGPIALLILIAELMFPAALTDLTFARKDPHTIFEKPWIVQTVQDEYSHIADPMNRFRVWRVPELDRNLAQVFRIYDFGGYNPLVLRRQPAFEDAMVQNPTLADLAGIKYFPCALIPSRAATLPKTGDLCVNNGYFPHAFLADTYHVTQNENEIIPLMARSDMRHIVILESDPVLALSGAALEQGITERASEDPNTLSFRVRTNKAALLVVNDSYYPGWVAEVDGRETDVLQADYLFRAVVVPAGVHNVVFRFTSPLLKIGLILSTMGVISCVVIFFIAFRKRNRPFIHVPPVH